MQAPAASTERRPPTPMSRLLSSARGRAGTARQRDAFRITTAVVVTWAALANLLRPGFPPQGFDEPFYAVAAWRYVNGLSGAPPRTHAFSTLDNFEHPPLAKYLFGLAQLIAGHESVVADRIVAGICTLATAAILATFIGRAAGRWVGLLAGALVALLPMHVPGLPFRFGRYGYLDVVAEVGAVAAVALAWFWFRARGRTGWWLALATGAAAGLATAAKENGFLGVVGPVIVGLVLTGTGRRGHALLERLLQAAAAVVTSGAVFLASYAGVGQPISAIRFMWGYQRLHDRLGHPVTFAGQRSAHPPFWAFFWFVQHGLGLVVTISCVICVAAALLLRHDRIVLWCAAALAGPLVFHVLIARVVLGFYWVTWMPAFLALVALGAGELLSAARRARRSLPKVAADVIALAALTVLTTASVRDTYRLVSAQEPPSYADTVTSRDPLAYLRFDDVSGTSAADGSGRGDDGTYVGEPRLGQAGLLASQTDRAVRLDGRAQFVSLPARWADQPTYSVALWFETTRAGGYLASRDLVFGSKGWSLSIDAQGRLEFRTFNPITGGPQATVAAHPVTDGRPHQVVAVKSGHVQTIYLDGRSAASATFPAAMTAAPGLPISLGRRANGTGYFAGRLDEFAYFGRRLTGKDAADLYSAGTRP